MERRALLIVGLVALGSNASAHEPYHLELRNTGPAVERWIRLPAGTPERFDVSIELDGELRLLRLRRHSIRGPQFRVRAWLPGGRLVVVEPPEPATYRGVIDGDARSHVAAALGPAGLDARIGAGDGRAWVLRAEAGARRDAGPALHRLLPESVEAGAGPDLVQLAPAPTPAAHTAADHLGLHLTEIAHDVTHPFYKAHGGTVPDALAAVEAIMNEVDLVFARDALIRFAITDVIVRTAPFYEPGGTLLEQVAAEWNANHTDVPRDLVHVFQDALGGAAPLRAVCDLPRAYGVSGEVPGVAAHEIGHQFGASHCHDPGCNTMCGSCLRIDPDTKTVIVSFRDSLDCLEEVGAYDDPVPPYGSPESADLSREEIGAGPSLAFAVLGNDHDANLDPLAIESFDPSSERGGSVTLSAGSGPGGVDELVYVPPAVVFGGDDRFTYTVADGTGFNSAGEVVLRVDTRELLGYWKLDEGAGTTTADASGSGRSGSIMGAQWSGGVYGAALRFDGVDDHVLIGAPHRETAGATFTAWIYRIGAQEPFAGLLSLRGPDTYAGLGFGVADELRYRWNFDPAADGWDSGIVVPEAEWVLVAVAVERDRATIYLHDGAGLQSAVNPLEHDAEELGGFLMLGRDIGQGAAFEGQLDDVRVYAGALGPGEMAELFEHGGKAYRPSPSNGGAMPPGQRELSWLAGLSATAHDVYYGFDYEAVRDATTASASYLGRQAATGLLAPLPPAAGEHAYWRVDEVAASGVARGDVWIFATRPPFAHWALDEAGGTIAADAAGSSPGTYLGSPALDQSPALPELGRSVFFDGVDDAVAIPPLGLETRTVTFTAWIRRQGSQPDWAGILFSRGGTTSAGLSLTPAERLAFKWDDDDPAFGELFWDSGLSVPDGQWVFVALVVRPDRATMYRGLSGGVVAATRLTVNAREAFDGPLSIGRDPLPGRLFRGQIDDVRIYREAWTEEQVRALHAAGIAAGAVPDGDAVPGTPLRLGKTPGGELTLEWATACGGAAVDYAVYEGVLGSFDGHRPLLCTTAGATSATPAAGPGGRYFLVVPSTANREGSYGRDSSGAPRAPSAAACWPQFLAACD